jgi:hypothetical protein
LTILLAAMPLWSYLLVGVGIEFASTVVKAAPTLPFF